MFQRAVPPRPQDLHILLTRSSQSGIKVSKHGLTQVAGFSLTDTSQTGSLQGESGRSEGDVQLGRSVALVLPATEGRLFAYNNGRNETHPDCGR